MDDLHDRSGAWTTGSEVDLEAATEQRVGRVYDSDLIRRRGE